LGIWGLGIGDWGLGIGPNPQSPIPNPNPQSPIPIFLIQEKSNKLLNNKICIKNNLLNNKK
jgi:hypothetical protein